MAFPLRVTPLELDDVAEAQIADTEVGEGNSRNKVISSHRPRPSAPERPPIAAKPKRKPPPRPTKTSHPSLKSHSNHAALLSPSENQNVNSNVQPQIELCKNDLSEATPTHENEKSTPEVPPRPPPLPRSSPSKSRLARSLSSSKSSQLNNSIHKSDSQNSVSSANSSDVSVNASAHISPTSSTLHCHSIDSINSKCTSSIQDKTAAPLSNCSSPTETHSRSSLESSNTVKPSAIVSENKDKTPLEIIVDDGKVTDGLPASAEPFEGKARPPVPKTSPERGGVNPTTSQNKPSPTSPPLSSPPKRPPLPSKSPQAPPSIPATHRSFSQAPSPASVPLGQEEARNVTDANDQDLRKTEVTLSETGCKPKPEPPPLPKNPPPRLKRQRSKQPDVKSKSFDQEPLTKSFDQKPKTKSLDQEPKPKSFDQESLSCSQVKRGTDVHINKNRHNNIFSKKETSTECVENVTVQNKCEAKQSNIGSGESSKDIDTLDKSKNDHDSQAAGNKILQLDIHPPSIVEKNSPSLVSNASKEVISPPRPTPRKRLSIPPSLTDGELSAKAAEPKNCSEISSPQKTSSDKEPGYTEVYVSKQQPSEPKASVPEKENFVLCSGDNTICSVDSDSPSVKPVVESVINEPQVPKEDLTSSNDSDLEESVLNHGGPLGKEEPEATCDMLKEIEELLNSKLTGIDLDKEISFTSLITSNDNDISKSDVQEHTPKRPPRPKREASLSKRKARSDALRSLSVDSPGCISLSSIDLESTPTAESDSAKTVPEKPKRATLPRVNRSQSDVTGVRDIFNDLGDSVSFASNSSIDSELEKPSLPPRSESLRRSYFTLSQSQTPPPLPPRNKPRTVSTPIINTLCWSKSDLSVSQTVKTNMNNVQKSEDHPPTSQKLSPSEIKSKTASLGRLRNREDVQAFGSLPGAKKPVKPRPVRKAPPPPTRPKRTATFTSGDKNLVEPTSSSINVKADNLQSHGAGFAQKREKGQEGSGQRNQILSCESPPKGMVKKLLGNFFLTQSFENVVKNKTSLESVCVEDGNHSKRIKEGITDDEPKATENDQEENPKNVSVEGTTKEIAIPSELSSSEKDKAVSATEQDKDASTTEQDKDVSTTEKDKDVTTTEKDKDVSTTEKDKDVSTAEKDKDVSTTEKERDLSATEQDKDVSMTEQDKDVSMTEQDKDMSTLTLPDNSHSDDESNVGDAADGPNSSGSESEEDAEEIYQTQKKAKKIFNIAKEIASSESVFVDVLRLLNVDFRQHISKETEKYDQPIIPSEILNRILQFLPQLHNLNEELLKDLEQRISHWNENPQISDIFVRKGPFLKLYSSYIGNFENSCAVLDDSCKKHSRFASAVKEFEMGPRCAKLALKHYMLKPVQRIPQYKLLFQDYLKHLSIDSADFKPTQAALEIVSSVADHANESMRNWDNIQKLLEIQRNLIGQFEVIQPGRELIKQGELMKLSRKEMQPRMFFLFSDVLLYTTPVTTGYKLNNILQISRMQVEVPKVEEFKYEINIIGKERSFTVCASTEKEKEEWLEALVKTIDEKKERYQTFMKHSEAEEQANEDSLLGHKAPVWVPDTRVTMCMLCYAEFTITWRRHHCRSCGKIVCKYCSGNTAPLAYLDNKPARVCDLCFKKLAEVQKTEPEVPVVVVDDGSGSSVPDSDDSKASGVDKNSGFGFITSLFYKSEKNGNRKKSSSSIPSVLKEVHANDEGSDLSGYLRAFKNRKWKKLWFVVKGKVLYTYKACEDMAAVESMPLLGYDVITVLNSIEGADPDCLFELVHQNKQRLLSKESGPSSPNTQRMILRADTKSSAQKWVNALREATQA